jgi:hypothetical protein
MSRRHNPVRGAFRFSVRDVRTTAFGGVPYPVANDAINRAWDEKLRKIGNKREGPAQDAPDHAAPSWRSVFGLPG